MMPKFRFFQSSFSATLLKSAALAVALLVQASPARAEVVTLICQHNAGPGHNISFTLRINYGQKVVEFLSPSGTVWFSAVASITDSDLRWNYQKRGHFTGSLNRLSGEGVVEYPADGNNPSTDQLFGPCRRATQKF